LDVVNVQSGSEEHATTCSCGYTVGVGRTAQRRAILAPRGKRDLVQAVLVLKRLPHSPLSRSAARRVCSWLLEQKRHPPGGCSKAFELFFVGQGVPTVLQPSDLLHAR
jgi:hypothetical protein